MNKRLHILFLCSWYPSRVLPNNGDFIQRHAEAVALKHKVTAIHIISDDKLKKTFEITDNNINQVRTIVIYLKATKNPLIKIANYFKAFKRTLSNIEPFDLVHLNVTYPAGLLALYLKWFKQKPFIISEHWTDYQYPLHKKIKTYRKLITRKIVKNAAFVCPVSKHLQNAMIAYGLKGKYHKVPNVVNTNIFKPKAEDNQYFTLTHISNMDNNHKNIEGLLNAISKLKTQISNLKVNLIGQNAKAYQQYSQKLSLKNINFINQIPHSCVANYLNKTDIFVLFSNYENLPCVILEAFACGVPVVSTNVGGISEYFPKDFGYLVAPKDKSAFKSAILNIYNSVKKPDKQLMHQYAKKHFGQQAIATSFSELYTQSLSKKSN